MDTNIDFSKIVEFPSGVRVANCTPHLVVFLTTKGEEITVEPCGATLLALTKEEEVATKLPVKFVKAVFQPTSSAVAEVHAIRAYGKDILIVGSLVSAQAYAGMVVAMTPAPGYERVPIAEKRMNPDKFTVF